MKKSIIFFFLLIISMSCKEKTSELNSNSEKIQNTSKDSAIVSPKDSAENTTQPKPTIDKPKTLEKTVDCEDKGGNMEIGFTTECFWENYTLEETYLAFRKEFKDNDDGKFLEEKMPKANYKATFKEYPLAVDYKYSGGNELKIEILFPGGVTFITFKKVDENVITTIVASPD